MSLTVVTCNAQYRELLACGATSLSVVFDLPTRMGRDSDAPMASGHVGRSGVAVDSVDDMRVLFSGIPLDRISTSMAAGASAAVLVLLYQLVAEEQGVAADRLRGQAARRSRIFPPGPSARLDAELRAYCRSEIPEWFTGPQPAGAAARQGHGSTDPAVEARQAERIAKLRAWRCQERVAEALLRMRRAAAGSDNVVYPMKDALSAGATVGEVCDVLRDTWGTHPPAAADHAGGADPAGATV